MLGGKDYRFFARAYAWCERIVFRDALQRCRVAFLDQMKGQILSVGEGDGRFLEVAQKRGMNVVVVEPDESMRKLARERNPDICFVEITEAPVCEVVVLNFVLDLFTRAEAEGFLDQLPTTQTLVVADFFPRKGSEHLLVWLMYRAFGLLTGLKTRQLPPVEKILTARGWVCRDERTAWHGFIRSQWWTLSQNDCAEKNGAGSPSNGANPV